MLLTAAPRPCPPPPPRRPPFVREIGAHSARSSPQPGRRTCTAQELLDHRPPRSRRWSGGQLSSSNTRLSMRTLVLVVRLYPTLRRAASRAPSETHTRRSSSHGRRLAGGGGPAITDCFCRHHCCSRGRSRMMCMGQVALERSFLRRCQRAAFRSASTCLVTKMRGRRTRFAARWTAHGCTRAGSATTRGEATVARTLLSNFHMFVVDTPYH